MTPRLPRKRWPLFSLLGMGLFVGIHSTGCGTGAVGVDDCRAIELVRCEEAIACGIVDDVEACQRYYRGHCLHGLAVSSRPSRDEREDCTAAIRQAGLCAREHGAEAPLTACSSGPPTEALPERTFETVCDVVARPWDGVACGFLSPPPEDEKPSGGDAGAGGSDDE